MKNKILGPILIVLGIIITVTTGTTLAYFNITIEGTGNNINGITMNFDVNLTVTPIYESTNLVPIENDLINQAVNNNCIDKRGYQVCTLYKLTLVNNGDQQILKGYITAESGTTYITEHLKGQLFNSNLTEEISDVLTLTDIGEINTEEKRYFQTKDKNLFTTELTNENIFYLAIWLTEARDYQEDDYRKNYLGKIAFESEGGERVTAEFNS